MTLEVELQILLGLCGKAAHGAVELAVTNLDLKSGIISFQTYVNIN